MHLKNQIYSRLVIVSIIVLIVINLIGLVLSIHDLFYLKKIIFGKPVPDREHAFFVEKNKIQYWVTTVAYLTYLILFLTWFYRTYKNVYVKESDIAPFKPGIVPFSYIIPIFNFYGPYKIMRFIWWGNAFSLAELSRGYKTIKSWWLLTILSFIVSRITAAKYKDAVYADAFMTATYFHLFVYALIIHFLILTLKLVKNINRNENTPPIYSSSMLQTKT